MRRKVNDGNINGYKKSFQYVKKRERYRKESFFEVLNGECGLWFGFDDHFLLSVSFCFLLFHKRYTIGGVLNP